ncbi:MAG: type II secretion system secretin GspD [Gammaproteobacteria bacterium]|nr:type II secretion system secretin GspD [Gammaproteobacteria bacterium]
MNRTSIVFYRIAQLILLGLVLLRPVSAEDVTLNFSDADLVAVINSVSQITGKNFIIDPRVKGKVTVVSSKPLNHDEVYNVFLSILQVHGFATVPTEHAIKIIPDATAKQSATPFTNKKSTPEDQLITRVLKINFINAAQMVPILRPLIAQQGHLAAYAATNVLIVSDRAANIRRVERIVAQMDRESDSDVEIIKLEHAFAAEVVRLLSSLNVSKPDKKAASSAVKFSADERTNSILLSGDKTSRLKFRAIISALDSPVQSSGNTHVIYLRYADAKNVATILGNVGKEVIKAVAKNSKSSKAGGTQDSVNVQADEASNALVITAPASVFPSLRSVIQQLDIRRAQVHIEAIIAEVSMTANHELGVQWLIDGGSGDRPVVSMQFGDVGTTIPGLVSGLASGLTPVPDGLGIGLGQISDSGLSFITLISAMAADRDSNLLSTPSIVTLDNQEAEIIVGQNVPFVTGTTTSTGTDVSNPFQTIERQDVGVSLKVRPQINEGNTITMEIEQEVSSVNRSASSAVDLETDKRSIKTTVQLEDGELLVLGGLISDDINEIEQKIPVLGDIPILGALFRYSNTAKEKNNLMVFIRATIIKDPDKARQLSKRKYNFMREEQLSNFEEGEIGSPVLAPYE